MGYPKNHPTRGYGLLLFLSLLILTAFIIPIHLKLFPYVNDDAYIHIRIAQNFVKYGKPYFNPGEAINASSSPVWTIVLAFLFKYISDSPLAISILNSIITAIGLLIHTRLFYRLSGKSKNPYLYLLFGVCYLSLILSVSIDLMETPFALLILGIALHLLLNKNKLCLILFGILIFVRFEFISLLCLIFYFIYIKRTFSLKETIIFPLLGILPLLTYEMWFFKTIIPNTILAKSKVYEMNYWGIYGNIIIIIILAYITIYLLKEFPKNSSDSTRILHLLSIFGFVTFSSYILSKALIFAWYTPIFLIPMLYEIFNISFIRNFQFKFVHRLISLPTTTFFLYLILELSLIFASAYFNAPNLYPRFTLGARVRNYIKIGQELYQKYPNATLLTSEIGGLGYGFKGHIVDGVGLVSPEALKYHPMKVPDERSQGSIGAIPVKYIEDVNPELIVSNDLFIEAFLDSKSMNKYIRISEPAYLEEDLILSNHHTVWENSKLSIFVRKDLYMASVNLESMH